MKVSQKLEAAGFTNIVNIEGELQHGMRPGCRSWKERK